VVIFLSQDQVIPFGNANETTYFGLKTARVEQQQGRSATPSRLANELFEHQMQWLLFFPYRDLHWTISQRNPDALVAQAEALGQRYLFSLG